MKSKNIVKQSQTKPIVVLLAAIAVQLCLGTAYVWSVFQNGIAQSIFGGDNSLAGLSFSIQIGVMTIGSVIGGRLVGKYTIRRVVTIGFVLMSIGFFLASFSSPEFPYLIWITYGIIGGFGMGITYTTTIACAQEWYPAKKGLVTGVIVAALGFGGVIFAPIAEKVIASFGGQGVGELNAFMVLSGIFFVCGVTSAQMLKKAPQTSETSGASSNASAAVSNSLLPSQALRTPHFYLLTLAFLLSSMGGLMMIGFAKPIAVAKGLASTATLGVLFISIFNSTGRIVWGAISDKLGRLTTMLTILIGSSLMSLIVNYVEGYYIYGAICLIGFFYGGLLSNFPTITADLFGGKYLAYIYGIVLLGFGAGAIVASMIAGYYKNLAAKDISLMTPAFIIAACCGAVSVFIIYGIYKTRKYIK